MKRVFSRRAWIVMLTLATMSSAAMGKTLMGSYYGDISYVHDDFGSNPHKEAYGEGEGVTGLVNLGLKNSIDVRLGLGYHWADGMFRESNAQSRNWKAEGDFLFSFKRGNKVNPYLVAGLSLNFQDVELQGYGFEGTDLGIKLGFGGEFEVSPKVLARAELDYVAIEGYNDTLLSGLLGYWFTDRILGHVSAGYAFDAYDTLWSVGVAFPF